MEHIINNMTIAASLSCYRDFFWKAMRGSDVAYRYHHEFADTL